jgi:hypothetical protein
VTRPHNPDVWSADQRPIVGACLPSYEFGGAILLASDGWEFERFERNGEMAPIPYLRATRLNGAILEAALREWSWVQFAQVDFGETPDPSHATPSPEAGE